MLLWAAFEKYLSCGANMGSIKKIGFLLLLALKGKEQDYTILGIRHSIVLLAIPMMLEMMMESLFAVVDIFFVGRLGQVLWPR